MQQNIANTNKNQSRILKVDHTLHEKFAETHQLALYSQPLIEMNQYIRLYSPESR